MSGNCTTVIINTDGTTADGTTVGSSSVQMGLLIADLILTSVVTILTSIRFRAKCGRFEMAFKPKNSPQSPGSIVASETASPAAAPAESRHENDRATSTATELEQIVVVPDVDEEHRHHTAGPMIDHSPYVQPLIPNSPKKKAED